MKYLGRNFVILKMERASSSKTLALALDPTRRQNPEDSYPANACNEERKTKINISRYFISEKRMRFLPSVKFYIRMSSMRGIC